MKSKYNIFLNLLNFNTNRHSKLEVFTDFITLFAISLSNKVLFNKRNNDIYIKIMRKYSDEEKLNFYSMSAELQRLFKNEMCPYDILGDIYKKVNERAYFELIGNKNTKLAEVGKKVQGLIKINKKDNSGEMMEINCGTGSMILAYASTLNLFKLDYRSDMKVTAIDSNIFNVFMTYIQLYFFGITAIVILIDESSNKELMRLYTPQHYKNIENLMVA